MTDTQKRLSEIGIEIARAHQLIEDLKDDMNNLSGEIQGQKNRIADLKSERTELRIQSRKERGLEKP